MKKDYLSPEFDFIKLSFENLLTQTVQDSKAEGSGFAGDDNLDE